MGRDHPVRPHWDIQAPFDLGPRRRRRTAGLLGGPQSPAQHLFGGHHGEGVVVGRFRHLRRARRPLDLEAALRRRDPADDPVCDAREHRPRILVEEGLVPGRIGVESEGPGRVQRSMVLVRRAVAGARRRLLPRQRRRLPRELQPLPPRQPRIGPRRGQATRPEIQHRPRRLRLRKQQRRHAERVDVPHHMAVVVVIVMPGGQAEDRRRGRRSRMGRGIQVEEGRVDDLLVKRRGALHYDTSLPEVGPGRAITLTKGVETRRLRSSDASDSFLIRTVVEDGRHHGDELPQADRLIRSSAPTVFAAQRAGAIPSLRHGAFRLGSDDIGRQGDSTTAEVALGYPKKRAVARRLGGSRGVCPATGDTTAQPARLHDRTHRDVTGRGGCDLDLLQQDRRRRPAGEGRHHHSG